MTQAESYHLFNRAGLNVLIDVPTGAVHVIDTTAANVLPFMVQGRSKDELPDLLPEIGLDCLESAWDQLQDLVNQGMLLGPEPRYSQRPGGGQLKAMCLHVAHDCDLRCRYCFAGTGSFGGSRGLMDFQTASAAVDLLLSSTARVCEMDFFGGEPLLNLDVVEQTAEYAREQAKRQDKVVNLTLTTNAYALDKPTRDRLAALSVDLVLSHDGRELVHNAMRPCAGGKSSYTQVTDNILAMIEQIGDRHYVRGTYTAHNIDFVEDIRHWLDLGLRRFSLEPVIAPSNSAMAITPNDLPALREQYWQLADLALNYPQAFTFFHFLVDWEQGPCGAKRAAGCGAGVEYIAVAPDGCIYPCHQFVGQQRWQMGDVHRGISCSYLREVFVLASMENKSGCQQCWARYYCGGGCHANAWWANSSLDQPWELGCEMLKIRTEAAIYLKVRQALGHHYSEGDSNG
jgi:uncharacterized protein